MTIEHIPPNDWATVGARLEKYVAIVLYCNDGEWRSIVSHSMDDHGHRATGTTPLEALTAALDAAEGKR